jgi:hypothetical protein
MLTIYKSKKLRGNNAGGLIPSRACAFKMLKSKKTSTPVKEASCLQLICVQKGYREEGV